MKIIKDGRLKDKTIKFVCPICGCEFEAEIMECVLTGINLSDFYLCDCPQCQTRCMEKWSETNE